MSLVLKFKISIHQIVITRGYNCKLDNNIVLYLKSNLWLCNVFLNQTGLVHYIFIHTQYFLDRYFSVST